MHTGRDAETPFEPPVLDTDGNRVGTVESWEVREGTLFVTMALFNDTRVTGVLPPGAWQPWAWPS